MGEDGSPEGEIERSDPSSRPSFPYLEHRVFRKALPSGIHYPFQCPFLFLSH